MNRRAFVTGLGAVLATPRGAEAQQPRRPRIGYLSNSADVTSLDAVFLGRLRELGYVDDQIVTRFSAGQDARLPQLAAELVRSSAEVLATWGPAATSALKKESDKIPIVFMSIADPISKGFVASLARPGGNLTGVADATEQYSGKRLELLKEAVPRARRFGVLMNERIMRIANRLDTAKKEFTDAARALHAELKWFSAQQPG
ncbi:MAG TPA: ABC transporter substrate binding protein [Vicinamibacterales bacterium]|nr:ABC transporter substrate binding protein [Vicinamibacterales bacterium]